VTPKIISKRVTLISEVRQISNDTIMFMLAVSFLTWWYGHGWRQVAGNVGPRLSQVAAAFSVGQLLRTLFAPWRRIVTYPGASLTERWRAFVDNLVSRVIGFFVRFFMLFAALFALLTAAIALLLEMLLWPLLPLAIPGLIIAGLII
jgi:hypothetical protein